MTGYSPRVLVLSGPVEPPWTRSDKNLVRGVAANLQHYRARVLTHEGVAAVDPRVETEAAWGPRVGGHTPLGRRVGLFNRLLATGDAQLVHLFWPADFLVATMVRVACRMRGLPVIHTLVRAPRTMVGIHRAIAGPPVVCLSRETLDRIRAEGVDDATLIPPGVAMADPIPAGRHNAIRERYSIPLGRPIVIYAGDYRHSNAARTVAATVPRILREVDCHFVLACRIRNDKDRSEAALIKEAIAADGLARHVTFLGEVKNLREFFAIAAVQVFPADSHHEKMDQPMVLLEGMAEGLATVVANKPPLEELVEAGAALGVPSMEPVSLAVAVVELIRDPRRRQALGRRGRKLVQERYDIQRVASRYEALYDSVLGVHRSDANSRAQV
jgi:glycosyltransferase involved in cell wall biosynthesis